MDAFDVIVIGCGVSGAAIACELSQYDLKVAVLEKENDVATGATKANSGIMHAGFDPHPGTLMAKLNVRGSALAREVCRKLDVPYKECGAMVVAFSEEEKQILERLYQQGVENGVQNQEIITGEEARNLEPNLSEEVKWVLLENDSAIVSPWELALALAETAVKNGVQLFLNREVTGLREEGSWQIETRIAEGALLPPGDTKETLFTAKTVINAAGLFAEQLRDMVLPHTFKTRPKRGQYYLLDKSEGTRVSRTIFQAPTGRGKGVLVSPTVHGNLIVGPNSEDVIGNDTATSWEGLDKVSESAKKSVPSIDLSQNIRNFSGVRARTDEDDFILERHGSYIDVAGICSPGLSSALGIGEYVRELLEAWNAESHLLNMQKKENVITERKKIRFKELSPKEKQELIQKDPAYAHVVCRCETITEGEIRDALHSPIPPVSLDGIKRRTGTGMGRCQGGFCGPQIARILAEELGISETEILQEGTGSKLLVSEMAEKERLSKAPEGGAR